MKHIDKPKIFCAGCKQEIIIEEKNYIELIKYLPKEKYYIHNKNIIHKNNDCWVKYQEGEQ